MTARVGATLAHPDYVSPTPRDALRARYVLGPAASSAIARRLDPALPDGRDFASQLRTLVDLARHGERAG